MRLKRLPDAIETPPFPRRSHSRANLFLYGMTDDLSPEAAAAWQAYQSMSASKDEYFSLLQALDEKYKTGGEPGIAESLKLEKLLSEHDHKVKQFNQALSAITDPGAKQQLVELLKVVADSKASH